MTRNPFLSLLAFTLALTACAPQTAPQPTAAATASPLPAPTAAPIPAPTGTPTLSPAWTDWLAALAALQNTRYGLGADGGIMVVAEHPAVVGYEQTHVRVRDEEMVSGWRVMSLEEAEAQGLDYEPLAPEVAGVEIADKGLFEVDGGSLLYAKSEVGRFENGRLEFVGPSGERVSVDLESLRWRYAVVDDGLGREGKLENQRVVARLEVVSQAPEGLEGEWVAYVFERGEWHAVPEPAGMLAFWQGLREGKSVAEVMGEIRSGLPADWRDLPEVDEEVVDIYLAQQAQVWEKVKDMIEGMSDEELGMLMGGHFTGGPGWDLDYGRAAMVSMGNVGSNDSMGIGMVGAFRLGKEGGKDLVVWSMPVRLWAGGESHWMLWNVLLDPSLNDSLVVDGGYLSFDSILENVKYGRKLSVDMGLITSIDGHVPSDVQDLLAWVERNNGMVPRLWVSENEIVPFMYEYDRLMADALATIGNGVSLSLGNKEFILSNYYDYVKWLSESVLPALILVGE